MAGGFAHVTLVDRAHARLDEVEGLSEDDILDIGTLPTACQLGAAGPDYPYLAVAGLQRGEGHWADLMHYRRTGQPLRVGIAVLRAMPKGPDRARALAWLFGFAAHIATDLTIHPVVLAKVGPYAENKAEHRTCEMHQDVHIWSSRDIGDIERSEYFDALYDPNTVEGRLHPAIAAIWTAMLRETYPDDYEKKPPAFDAWHAGFHRAIDMVEDMPIFARHMLAHTGQAYPKQVDRQYIEDLETPAGRLHYDDICKRAEDNILALWSILGRALNAGDDDVEAIVARIPDGDLDTGRLLADSETYAMWRLA